MDRFYQASSETLGSQIRAVKRMHFTFGTVFILSSILLVVLTTFSTQIFTNQDNTFKASADKPSYTEIDENAPLPRLLPSIDTKPTNVQVKGIEIVNLQGSLEGTLPTTNTQRDPFVFTTSKDSNKIQITTSWKLEPNIQGASYIIYEHKDTGDKELFSIYGKDLEELTNTIVVDHHVEKLHLKVISIDESGKKTSSFYSARSSN